MNCAYDLRQCVLRRQRGVVHLTSLQFHRWGNRPDIAVAFYPLYYW
jgi:hypothetical protein